ncbi:glycoside hydrolase family 2 protein [Microvirga massiliensis]|uniref:glycoside hydrolase family 2 protein n=1 Tax=Microvirga massiliensis TaxID=1033741 RepID=UPI00062BD596|nr:glycoside hydrolase family 2 [Microvirga massiliensis]
MSPRSNSCENGPEGALIGADTLVMLAGRRPEHLDGPWSLTLDLFGEGLNQNWAALDEKRPIEWELPRDYDIAGGEIVHVPSCWNVLRPEWRFFEGTGWYTRSFEWQQRRTDERVVLYVGAAAYEARVYLNGYPLGRHRGASTPFCVELTDALETGANRLQIAVNNQRLANRIPPERFDWFNYGGLYREVHLVRLPALFILDATVSLVPDGGRFTLLAEVTLSDPTDGTAHVSIPELDIEIPVPVSAGRGAAVVAVTPALWSPASPKLYRVVTRFGNDLVEDQIGFREIRADGPQLLLNGAPIYLRGICAHEDDVALGKSSTREDVERRFGHARALNCNFLRLTHYPHHENVAKTADERGLLLWEEIPVYWNVDFASDETYRDAENQMQELIRRDRNRASVILWSIGNETPDTVERTHFLSRLADMARHMDPTRLVTAACTLQGGMIKDSVTSSLDVIGINQYFGWYDPDLPGLARFLEHSFPGKPVLISEVGADALAGLRDPSAPLFSEERQAQIYRQQFEMLARASYVCGVSPWLLYDFRSERRQSSVQRGFNRKGLIAEDKNRTKLAFGELARIYQQIGESRP